MGKSHLIVCRRAGIESDSDTEDEEDAQMSLKDRLLGLVARVIGLKRTAVEVEGTRPQSASKCIIINHLSSFKR